MTAATVAHVECASNNRPAPSGCVHGPWRYAGLAVKAKAGSACERPVMLVCMACGLSISVDCQTTRSAQCEPCGLVYRGRVQRVARVRGDLLMLTLTAPGSRAHSVKSRSGAWVPCPCTVKGGTDIARWNADAGRMWNRFLNDGIRADGHFSFMRGAYLKVTEKQERGALHFHVLIRVRAGEVITPADIERLTHTAMHYGFGHRVDLQEVEAGRGAHYVAKYVAKAANVRSAVPWAKDKTRPMSAPALPVSGVVVANEWAAHGPWREERTITYVSTRATYRTWSASRDWPNTMRALREAQVHYAALLAALPTWEGYDEGLPSDVALWTLVPDRPDGPPASF